jgi:hypothetical protein
MSEITMKSMIKITVPARAHHLGLKRKLHPNLNPRGS